MLYPLKLAKKVPDFFHFSDLVNFLLFQKKKLQCLACLHFCILTVSILLRGCILIVSKIDLTWPNQPDLTWPNQPGPCGTLWSSHYNNISHVVRAGRRVISSLLFEVFIPNTGILVTLRISQKNERSGRFPGNHPTLSNHDGLISKRSLWVPIWI